MESDRKEMARNRITVDHECNRRQHLGLILQAVLTLSSATAWAAADSQGCKLSQLASVDLAESANGHLLVPASLAGTEVLMLLNTNTVRSTVIDAVAKRLGLKSEASSLRVHDSTTGSNSLAQLVKIQAFAVGNVRFSNLEFMEYPASALRSPNERDYADGRVAGILGMDILSSTDVELDVAHLKMNLYSQNHCSDRVVYWSRTYDAIPIHSDPRGSFFFPIELEGKKIESTLGTFQLTTTLATDVTKKVYGFDETSKDVELELDASGRTVSQYRAMQLDAVGFKIVNAQITLGKPRGNSCRIGMRDGAVAYENCEGNPPLALGLNVLRKLHVYIATKEKVLYLTPADATNQE
jgi:hypothetical protein